MIKVIGVSAKVRWKTSENITVILRINPLIKQIVININLHKRNHCNLRASIALIYFFFNLYKHDHKILIKKCAFHKKKRAG